MYSVFICVKRLRNSASSTLGSLGASVILRGIPEVWKRNAVEDIAGLTGMRGWGGMDLWELLSFRKQASPPWAGAKAGSGVGLSKANCQQQLGGPFFCSTWCWVGMRSSRGWTWLRCAKWATHGGRGAGCQPSACGCCSPAALLSLVFWSLSIMCIGVNFFLFILLGMCFDS